MQKSLFGSVPIPRYVQLAGLMRQRIGKGHWAPGDLLPSIEQLMAEFGVARVTVRQATQLLAQEGLLSPERGRGTFVTEVAGRKRQLLVETTLDDLVEMYRGDMPDLANIIESDEQPILTQEDGTAAPEYFHMRRVHARDGERYCVVSIYIDSRVFQLAPSRFRQEVVLPILTSLPGVEIAKAKQTLRISTADLEIARDMHVPVNSPVGDVRRVLCAPDGTVIYLGEATYRGDYIRLEMDLKP
ncbi:MAG: GntR family transcriptional regulator [Gammaproteobacteria bacterium]|nr:GntR family transcriptional regulator [Gammaproteobacteria bacterium]